MSEDLSSGENPGPSSPKLDPLYVSDEFHDPSMRLQAEKVQKDRYRIVVMGAAGVGKTCLIKRFLFKHFLVDYKATLDQMYTEDYILDGKYISLDFLDTSGGYDFPAMRKVYISQADAFILVFSVDDSDSFDEVTSLREQVIQQKKESENKIPILIIGNKSDIIKDRKVQLETSESLVLLDWENGYAETSAKENDNVDGAFRELLKQANIKVKHSRSMLRRRDSAPVFQNPFPKITPIKKNKKRNSCKTC